MHVHESAQTLLYMDNLDIHNSQDSHKSEKAEKWMLDYI